MRSLARSGRLTPTGEFFRQGHHRMEVCLCDCGNTISVSRSNLLSGNTRSCGCLRRELAVEKNTTHGGSGSRLHDIWRGMKYRCATHPRYAGRGIQVCGEWEDFSAFRSWAMAHGYTDDLTIDRIDPDAHYSPDNCEWVTRPENSRRVFSARRA